MHAKKALGAAGRVQDTVEIDENNGMGHGHFIIVARAAFFAPRALGERAPGTMEYRKASDMAWFGIFKNSKKSNDKRVALKAWRNKCRWDWTTAEQTDHKWVAAGGFVEYGNARFDHPSAHALLGRYDMVDHWLPMVAKEAVVKMYEELEIAERWARVDHLDFWKELGRVFEKEAGKETSLETAFTAAWEAPWATILKAGGECGSLAPFQVAPPDALAQYAQSVVMPHPRVGLWMVSKGLCTLEQLREGLNAKTLPMLNDSRLSFAGTRPGEPMSVEYAADWCQLFLKNYDLPIEAKVRLVGQTIYSLGYDAWKTHIEPVCAPYLADVELDLVYAACEAQGPDESSLQRTVRLASQRIEDIRNGGSLVQDDSLQEPPHDGVLMMLHLSTPQNRVDLYLLAYVALQIDKGVVHGVDTLELPALG